MFHILELQYLTSDHKKLHLKWKLDQLEKEAAPVFKQQREHKTFFL